MHSFWRDLVYGLRSLRRRPGFTAAAVASLMLGIGTNSAIFTLYYAVSLRPLPLADLDRLVTVSKTLRNDAGEFVGDIPFSHGHYLHLSRRLREVELGIYQLWPMNLTGGSEPERVNGMFVSGNYFDLLGLASAHGRLLGREDAEPASEPVAVLSHGCWTRLFGADPAVLGSAVAVNGEPLTIVGVAPRGFRGTELQAAAEVFLPVPLFKRISPHRDYFDRLDTGLFNGIGRLRDGVSAEQGNAEVMDVARQVAEEFPELALTRAKAVHLAASAIHPRVRGQFQSYARSSFIVAVILFIACLSVSNLLFVRGVQRARELAVRQALGAGRGRLVRQLLTENLLLFLIGGLASLLVAWLCLRLLWVFRPPEVDGNALQLHLNAWVWAFSLAVALLAGLLFGLWPALRAASTDLVQNLRESPDASGRSKSLPRLLKPRSLAVALQVALALVALIGAGLFLESFRRTLAIDLGFSTGGLALASVAPGEQGYDETETREIYRRLLEETKALPGVLAAALSQNRLLRGAMLRRQVYLGTEASDDGRPFNRVNVVGSGFFATAGIPLVAGRDFLDRESDGRQVAIVNETMAASMWPDRDPIGQEFHFDYPTTPPIEVVGVAADARYRDIHEAEQYFIYLPLSQNYASHMTIHARFDGDPAAGLPALRQAVRAVDPRLVVADVATMEHFVDEALWMERASAWLLSLFGALALALALVGVYGLLSYSVSCRRRELGILIALGARRRDIFRELLAEAFQVAVAGIVLGLAAAAVLLKPILASRLYEVSTLDPATYGTWALVLLLAALAGSLLPAGRAARTRPNEALRAD